MSKAIKPRPEPSQEHKTIIDLWLNTNNAAKAVQEVNPELNYNTAKAIGNQIIKSPENKAYIDEKRQEIRASANIETEQITTELINWIYSDPTDFINLTPAQIKAMPSEIKRCLQGIKHRTKEYVDRQGQTVKEEIIEVRLNDKLKAVEILNKMLGNYSLDNSQKNNTINIENLNVQELKLLANILNKAT